MKICNICNETFESGRSYSNHVRWKHKNVIFHDMKKCQFCDKLMGDHLIILHENSCIKNPKNVKYCKQCGKMISKKHHILNAIFCDHHCAATYNNNKQILSPKETNCCLCGEKIICITNKKIYCEKCFIKRRNKKQLYRNKHIIITQSQLQSNIKYKHICVVCNSEFYNINKKVKTCNILCAKKLLSIKAKNNPNCGGETNHKRFEYNGIHMDSSWELEIAQYMDDQNIEWQRTRKIMFWWTDKNGLKRRYYPDFYLPKYDLYLDPKNKYLLKLDEYKLNQVIKENNINLIYGHRDLILEKLKTWACSDRS